MARGPQGRLVAIACGIAAALSGCQGVAPPHDEDAPRAPVQAEAAKKVVLGGWTNVFGTTHPLPNQSARISAAVEGRVLSVLGDGIGAAVVEGQQVKAGQIIVRLDDRVLRANRAKLQAAVHDLEEQRKQAGYALDLAMLDVQRLKDLLQTSSLAGQLPPVSRVEVEKAEILLKDAQSKQKSVWAKYAVAQAEVQGVDEQLDFLTLRAPIAGRLGIVQAVPGQTLTPGTVVADVMNLDPIDVLCFVPAHSAAKLALDQPARILADEGHHETGSKSAHGKVVFIAVQAQPETGNVAVKVRFPNPKLRLRAHTVVRVNILTKPEQARLTIPEAALLEDRNIPVVVAVQDVKIEKKGDAERRVGTARKLQVTLGVRDRDLGVAEILGLFDPATKAKIVPEGLLFVTAGAHGLQNDDPVVIEEAPEKEQGP